jgi:hypothetical protein
MYCGFWEEDYCALTESHQCSGFPKEPEYWHQKGTIIEEGNRNAISLSQSALWFLRYIQKEGTY